MGQIQRREEMTRTVGVQGQGSKRLGRDGVTGMVRVWNLGAVHGDRGRAKYLRVLHLVSENKMCLQGEKEKEKKR